MIDADELDKKTLREKWEVLADPAACPYPLKAFANSRLLEEGHPDPHTTTLLVELALGAAHYSVMHLTGALATFLDLSSRDNVWIEAHTAKARRVEITIIEEEK